MRIIGLESAGGKIFVTARLAVFTGALLAGALFGGMLGARAQDTRTVTEPAFPAACTVLPAQLTIASGEPSSETAFDTARIQTALNGCISGEAVELESSGSYNAFLIQPINIPSGVTLLIDGGVTVFASRNPADYQIAGGETCGTIGTKGGGCNPLIFVGNGNSSSGSGLMGFGVINGRGGDALLSGSTAGQSWWDVTNSDSTARTQNKPVILNAGGASNFTLYKITIINAPYFNVQWSGNGLTVWGIKIISPGSGPNTDGIDPSGTNITITDSSLSGGDDNVAVKAGNASADITVSSDNTYSGHGISVGSQTNGGLTNMLVENINQFGDGPLAGGIGLRLKSDSESGGLVQNVTYQNVCSDNVNYPVVINPNYDSRTGTDIPTFSNITFENIHVIGTKGKFQFNGYDANHLTTVTLNNFVVDSLPQNYITPAIADTTFTLGPGPVSPALLQTQTGTGVSYNGSVTNPTEAAYACSSSNFPLLVGELYLSTASASNLASYSTTAPGSFALNAMVQPPQSQVTYTNYESNSYTGVPAPTAAVEFLEGSDVVGTGSLSTNGTLASATIANATVGTHTYTAEYPGDAYYPALNFGSVTVTVSPGPAAQLAFFSGPAKSLVYGNAAGTVVVSVEDSVGDPTTSTPTVKLTVTGPNGYTASDSANAISGIATFNLSAILPGVGSYSYVASGTGLTSTPAANESVTAATLTVTAQPASRIFDAPNPAFSYQIAGYVNGDPSSVVTGAPTLTTSAQRTSNAGVYAISAGVGTLSAANYVFSTVGNTLTVSGGAAQAILFSPLPNFPSGVSYQLSARTTSGLPANYAVTGPASVSGGVLKVTGQGSVVVTAESAGNGNYGAAANVTRSFTAQ